jgi:hypothetical protein
MKPRTVLRALIGIAVSVVAIWILLRSVDLAKVAVVLGSASPAWLAVMIGTSLIDVGARAARWQILLRPIAAVPYTHVLGYTYIGYLANNVLPARLGELVRSAALGDGERLSGTTVLGTVVVERIVDTTMVVAIAAVAVLLLSVGGVMGTAVLAGVAFVGLAIGILALGIMANRLPGAARVRAFMARWPVILDLARRLGDGLAVARNPRVVVGAVAFSVLAWSASIATFFAGARAVGIDLSVPQAALVGSGVALISIVPSGPGYVGTFEFAATRIAGGFGVDAERAFAMALLVHAVILLVTTVGGIIAILVRRRRPKPAPVEAAAVPSGSPPPPT